jgi:pseudaminic acid cytidylyltransferase
MKLAVIPARGGSKRIPRKNIRPFAGRPIIAWSIDAAKRSGLFDHVIVSTDDAEIEAVAVAHGAEVPYRRPAELADDMTGLNPVMQHALRWYADRGEPASALCCIYPTAPFVEPRYLREGYERLSASGASFVLSVTTYAFQVQRAVRLAPGGEVLPLFPEYGLTRSQDLDEVYHDAGQFYWGRPEAFMNEIAPLSPASVAVVLPRYMVQDIDTPEDWRRAELMYAAYRQDTERGPQT